MEYLSGRVGGCSRCSRRTLRITGRAEQTFHLKAALSHAPVHAVVRLFWIGEAVLAFVQCVRTDQFSCFKVVYR